VKSKYDRIDVIDADLAWSAAFAAYRINGGYFKRPTITDEGKITRPTNRELAKLALYDATMIQDQDRKLAKKARQYLANVTTMNALKGELSEWGQISARVCSLDNIDSQYDLSVITAMPQSYASTLKKEQVDARLRHCDGHIGQVGDKIQISVEIVRHNYSAKYNTWFISGIAPDNQAVHFAYREAIQPGGNIVIRGTVKRHTDHSTQLNRVKIVEEVV
jgi:hypothetical protein